MAVQAPKLNHYLTENFENNVRDLERKACLYNALEKISWVALAAIVAVILTVSYSGVILTETMSLVLAATALSTLLFAWGVSQFRIWSDQYASQASVERHAAFHLKKISLWKRQEIETFLNEQGLDLAQIPLEPLKKLNAKEPLQALLRLIARFKSLEEMARLLEQEAQKKLRFTGKELTNPETRRVSKYIQRQEGWHEHEQEAIPRALDAAVMLRIIQKPTQELSINDLGSCQAKSLGERLSDLKYDHNDDYLVFHPALKRASLSLAEIERDMAPAALYRKLFLRA